MDCFRGFEGLGWNNLITFTERCLPRWKLNHPAELLGLTAAGAIKACDLVSIVRHSRFALCNTTLVEEFLGLLEVLVHPLTICLNLLLLLLK